MQNYMVYPAESEIADEDSGLEFTSASNRGFDSMVKVYTTSSCAYCDKVKKHLDEHGVAYEEIDVLSDPKHREDLVRLSGGRRSVPLTVFDSHSLLGYDSAELERILRAEGFISDNGGGYGATKKTGAGRGNKAKARAGKN